MPLHTVDYTVHMLRLFRSNSPAQMYLKQASQLISPQLFHFYGFKEIPHPVASRDQDDFPADFQYDPEVLIEIPLEIIDHKQMPPRRADSAKQPHLPLKEFIPGLFFIFLQQMNVQRGIDHSVPDTSPIMDIRDRIQAAGTVTDQFFREYALSDSAHPANQECVCFSAGEPFGKRPVFLFSSDEKRFLQKPEGPDVGHVPAGKMRQPVQRTDNLVHIAVPVPVIGRQSAVEKVCQSPEKHLRIEIRILQHALKIVDCILNALQRHGRVVENQTEQRCPKGEHIRVDAGFFQVSRAQFKRRIAVCPAQSVPLYLSAFQTLDRYGRIKVKELDNIRRFPQHKDILRLHVQVKKSFFVQK